MKFARTEFFRSDPMTWEYSFSKPLSKPATTATPAEIRGGSRAHASPRSCGVDGYYLINDDAWIGTLDSGVRNV
jgi:hypothetical protein